MKVIFHPVIDAKAIVEQGNVGGANTSLAEAVSEAQQQTAHSLLIAATGRLLLFCTRSSRASCTASISALARITLSGGRLLSSRRMLVSWLLSFSLLGSQIQFSLATRHQQVDVRQDLRIEQSPVQGTVRVVDAVAIAQHVEVVALAGTGPAPSPGYP